MKIERIVVGTDFSPPSQTAVEHAAALATHLSAELVVVHAEGKQAHHQDVPDDVPGVGDELSKMTEEHSSTSQKMLAEQTAKLGAGGLAVSGKSVADSPTQALCDTAEELEANLVVTGTHGHTGFQRLLLGSVAERVVHSCRRPVMVIRDGEPPTSGYRRILVPTDFSPLAKRALALALALAKADAEIELLHCWRLPPGAATGSARVVKPIIAAITKELEQRLKSEVDEASAGDHKLTHSAVLVPPAQGVQTRLATGDFDLVVMGSHGRTGLSRFLVGSVAEATLRHAPCSVAVVHAHGD